MQVLHDHRFVRLLQLNQWRQRSCTAHGRKPAKAPQNGRGIWIYDAAKAPQISSTTRRLQDLRSSRLEAFTFEWAIAADPDFSLLGRLNASQQPSLTRTLYKKQILLRFCKRRTIFVTRAELPCIPLTNTASVFHAWALRLIWVSPLCAHGSLPFREQPRPSRPPALPPFTWAVPGTYICPWDLHFHWHIKMNLNKVIYS